MNGSSLWRANQGHQHLETSRRREVLDFEYHANVVGIKQDVAMISIEFTIVPLRDRAGELTGLAVIVRDVTKRFKEMRAAAKPRGGNEALPPDGAA
jgi:PAS domain-containing protein